MPADLELQPLPACAPEQGDPLGQRQGVYTVHRHHPLLWRRLLCLLGCGQEVRFCTESLDKPVDTLDKMFKVLSCTCCCWAGGAVSTWAAASLTLIPRATLQTAEGLLGVLRVD